MTNLVLFLIHLNGSQGVVTGILLSIIAIDMNQIFEIDFCIRIYVRIAKFDSKVGSRRKSGCPHHYFGCPLFITLLYVCGTSSHTAVFVGKRKIS